MRCCIDENRKKMLVIFTIAVALYLISRIGADLQLFFRVVIKMILIICFPLILYLFNFYEQAEINSIIGAWKKWRKPRYWYKNLRELAKKQSMDGSDL